VQRVRGVLQDISAQHEARRELSQRLAPPFATLSNSFRSGNRL
jgi:hypothetical protein